METKSLNLFSQKSNIQNLAVILTYKCQMDCVYCFMDRNRPDMLEDVLFKSIDLLFTSPYEEIELQFFGGEPLLRWNLIKKAINYSQRKAYTKEKKIKYLITTNGLLLDKTKLNFLKKYKTTIMFSIDGDKNTQLENRPFISPAGFFWARIINNLSQLIESKINYFVNIVFLPKDVKKIKQNVNYLINKKVRNIQLSYAMGIYWPEEFISHYFKILKEIINIPGLNLCNVNNQSEPVLASSQIIIDSLGKIYIGCAGVLEKKFPSLHSSFYFGSLGEIKDITLLYRTKEQQMDFLQKKGKNFNLELKKIVLNNLEFGKRLSLFFKKMSFQKKENIVNSLMVMTTYNCQLACNYCEIIQSNRHMLKKVLFKAIDFLFTSKSPEVQLRFWGGEPLMRWGLIKQGIHYGEVRGKERGKKIKFMITTNGLFLDKKKIDFLKNHPVEIMFSLDGDKQTNQKHRICKDQSDVYDLLLRNLKRLIKSKIPFFINMIVTPLNVSKLFSNLIFFKNLGAKRIQICHQVAVFWSHKKIQEYLGQLDKIKKEPDLVKIIMNFVNYCEPQFLSNEIIIDIDGKIYFDGAIFLEKKYPEFRKTCCLGDVFSCKDIDSLFKTRDDIYFLFKEKARPQGEKIFLNNIFLGRKLAHFFDSFKYLFSPPKNERPFFVDFLKNEFELQLPIVKKLKISSLFFHLKGPCLNNCIFCHHMEERFTDFFEAEEEFPLNRKLKFKKICLIGNEPLLHPKILDFVSLAKKNGFKEIEILTSGEPLCDKIFLKELIKRGATSFSLPIFGSRREIHDLIVGRQGSFKELIQGLKNLKKYRHIKVYVHANLLRQNLYDLPDLEKMIKKEFNFPFVVLPVRCKTDSSVFKNIFPSYSEIIGVLKGKISSLFGFPYCVLKQIQKKNSFPQLSDSMKLYFIHQKFIKPNSCKKCAYFAECIGMFKDYLDIYYSREFLKYGKFKSG